MQLNDNTAISEALELTKLAIEHGYIRRGHSAEEAAENTYEYYKTLSSLFAQTKQEDDQ